MVTKKNYKQTSDEISILGLGMMRLPTTTDEKGDSIIDKAKAEEIVEIAYNNGVNYFDTAYPYLGGKSELFTGEVLKKYPRDSFNLATKLPMWLLTSKEDNEKYFNEQLEKLQVEYFDFYLLHSLNKSNIEKMKAYETYEFAKRMKAEGKIKKLGFSFHDSVECLDELTSEYDWDFAQLQINYLDWEMQNAKAQYEILEKKGIPCIVMEPVRGGLLASPCAEANEVFKNANPDVSVASWAIKYVASLPNVMTVLSGMSNAEQVIDNTKTTTDFKALTSDERLVIDKALAIYKEKRTIPCTDCKYCIDCPMGINIPEIFSFYNRYTRYNDNNGLVKNYSALPSDKNSTACIGCEACVALCPQKIDIPQKLKLVHKVVSELSK